MSNEISGSTEFAQQSGSKKPGSHTHPVPSTPLEQADPWEFGESDPVLISVRFDAEVADFARQSLSSCKAEEESNGSVIFQVPVTNWPAFRSFVLSFLDHAEVIAPPESRAEMIEWLEGIAGDING